MKKLIKTIKGLFRTLYQMGVWCIIALLLIPVLIIVAQPVLVFPGGFLPLFSQETITPPPAEILQFTATTSDFKQLNVWELPLAKQESSEKKRVALFFHGNAGDVHSFYPFQKMFQKAGINTYSFDYRGYGRSSGVPSEEGLYTDADAMISLISEREKIKKQDIIVIGLSLGSGPASYVAKKYNSNKVMLFAPFTSVPDVISSMKYFKHLAWTSWYEFPVLENIRQALPECLLVVHGSNDTIIPYEHGQQISNAITKLC